MNTVLKPSRLTVKELTERAKAFRPLRILTWLSVPFFPIFCLFIMDYMNYGAHLSVLLNHIRQFPHTLAFELLVVAIVFSVVLLLCRRLWLATGLFGAISLICAYVNYTKVALNGDHFLPQDILMLSNARELSSFISGDLPRWFLVGIGIMLLWVALFAFLGCALPLRRAVRLVSAGLIAICACLPCYNIDRADVMLSKFGMSIFDSALQRSNYTANGFVGAFTVNLLSLNVQEPENYSRESVESFLAPYSGTAADPNSEPFDVVVVLSESFFDARILDGVHFSQNPLSNYDRLLASEHCYSGSIYTTAMGGGTVRPEFGVLTGLTTDYVPSVTTPYSYLSQDISTYVSNYQDAGYQTIALHPYDKRFYSRDQAYGYLGFDRFLGAEEIDSLVGGAQYKRGYITDATTLDAILTCMEEAQQPTFLFAITMQNHQPFSGIDPSLVQVEVTSDRLSEPALTALHTYTQGLYDADQMLGALADWVDQRQRPTVLVFFGDHMPTLGSNYLAYHESGLFYSWDGLDTQERMAMYSTPFLIYSNRTLDKSLFSSHTGNTISDYNLLNAVAVSTGFRRTAYMNLLLDFYSTTPFYNLRLDLPLTDAIRPYTSAMEQISYDRIFGKNYTG